MGKEYLGIGAIAKQMLPQRFLCARYCVAELFIGRKRLDQLEDDWNIRRVATRIAKEKDTLTQTKLSAANQHSEQR